MMFLLNLHRNWTPIERFTEVLGSLRALEIPDREIKQIEIRFLYAAQLPDRCYGRSPEYIETVLEEIGIEVHWV